MSLLWAASSEFVSSSIPSWQISTAHAQPFRGAMDLAFCLKVPLDSLLVWASSEGSGETARMRRLAWTFAARIGIKYQIRLARPIIDSVSSDMPFKITFKLCLNMSKGREIQCFIRTLQILWTSEIQCTSQLYMYTPDLWKVNFGMTESTCSWQDICYFIMGIWYNRRNFIIPARYCPKRNPFLTSCSSPVCYWV